MFAGAFSLRVIGYCRVSTDRQASEGVSLAAQAERIAAWARSRPGEPAEVVLHSDEGISGKSRKNRPGLALALADAAAERGSVLAVYSLSRLARSTRDAIAISETLAEAGVDLVSLSESIDTTSAAGKMFFRIMAVLAEFDRDLAVERTRAAIDHKRSKGERLGQIPYGHQLGADGRTLAPDPGEQRVLALAQEWRASGHNCRRIASMLNNLNIPAKRGGKWSESTIRGILK